MSLFGLILALLLPDFIIYHGSLCNYEYLFFGLILALLLPGLTVSLCDSSCNYISFVLILDLLLFLSIYWHPPRQDRMAHTKLPNAGL